MLEGGAVAVGVAQAGLRTHGGEPIRTISVAGDGGGAAEQTAESLAAALGAEIIRGGGDADLILVDSQSNAPEGRIALGGPTRGPAGFGTRLGDRAPARHRPVVLNRRSRTRRGAPGRPRPRRRCTPPASVAKLGPRSRDRGRRSDVTMLRARRPGCR